MSENIDKKGWILMDLGTGTSIYFEKFSDCFPDLNHPLQVRVGDKYNKLPPNPLQDKQP